LDTFFHIPTENYTRAGPHCIYVMKSKKFFKLTIIHPKELILEKTNNNIKERKLNNLSIQSRLTSTLHGLYCKYPSFGPAIAITKRWLYSHMIDTLLWPEILTELIFAEMLLNQLTTSTVQPQGLFFNFLNKISNFDPQYEMIVCNFNEELSLEQIEEVERKFRKNRQNFPPIMTFTSLDDDRPSLWTINAPSINVFQHVRLLAQKCFELIEGNFMSLNSKQVSDVFSPSYSGFDVIIHLDSLLLRKFDVHTNFNFTKNAKREQKITPPADIDHAQSLLTELRQAFDEYAVFFLNPVGGNKIAVIFKPLMQKIKKGSVDNTKQSITVETMIHNISLIGQGLVTSIEVFD
jgi:U3 small nucleolar RNA-associated protein 22